MLLNACGADGPKLRIEQRKPIVLGWQSLNKIFMILVTVILRCIVSIYVNSLLETNLQHLKALPIAVLENVDCLCSQPYTVTCKETLSTDKK